jgi:hypothetical protein
LICTGGICRVSEREITSADRRPERENPELKTPDNMEVSSFTPVVFYMPVEALDTWFAKRGSMPNFSATTSASQSASNPASGEATLRCPFP